MKRTALAILAGLAVLGVIAAAPFSYAQSGIIILKGTDKPVTQPVKLSPGAYVLTRTAGSGFLSVSLKQNNQSPYVQFVNDLNESDLIIVGDQMLKAGGATLVGEGQSAWTIAFSRVEATGAGTLPLMMTGAEKKATLSKPFKATAGTITVAYAYKAAPKGTGTVRIVDVATGRPLPTKMITAGRASGTFTVPVPAAGTFIAATRFPLASGGGEVRISQ
jgi:hypothetical protein